MIAIDHGLRAVDLEAGLGRLFELSGEKLKALRGRSRPADGAPVFTVKGKYSSRGWTEWTQGFLFGWGLFQFDATGDAECLDWARRNIVDHMASHLTHFGVHDHGFNNVSTYGNLARLMNEGKIPTNPWERNFHALALKCSGAVQARRWTRTADGGGFIYSFNGPHSLFADTIRSLRSLAVAHRLGHFAYDEQDAKISLLGRLVQHARTTATHAVFHGEGRDAYDHRGRVAHESVFNTNNGQFRCPNSQQGYSPFSTWTRGLAWIMLGYAEQLEFLQTVADAELEPFGGRREVEGFMLKAARATCDFYVNQTPVDGVPYWDTGAPELHRLGDYLNRPADPFNPHEPVDSSAAAIAAQGFLRLGTYLAAQGEKAAGRKYFQAGLTIADTLFDEPYLSTDPRHQGLLLHSVYHRPNGWDYISPGRKVPCGEASMWGDYHALELALLIQRLAQGKYYTFF